MGLLNSTRVSAVVGGKEIILETGRLARQANGAIWVQCGGTVELDIYVTGGEGTALTGKTHIAASFETGEPTFGYTLSDDGKYYTLTSILDQDLTVVNIPDELGDGLPVTGFTSGLFRKGIS